MTFQDDDSVLIIYRSFEVFQKTEAQDGIKAIGAGVAFSYHGRNLFLAGITDGHLRNH